MMAESLITPDGPTLFDGVSALQIDDLDVLGYNAANSYIIPEFIDVDRFNAALAKALVFFPLYAARVSCAENGGGPWSLTLPPKAVTVSVSNETEIVPIEALVQKPLRFLPPLNPRKITLDSTTPLASILLTKFPKLGVTGIGITRWHPSWSMLNRNMSRGDRLRSPQIWRRDREEARCEQAVGIEAMIDFKIGEKFLPLVAKPMSDIIPKSFDASIVYTAGSEKSSSDEDVFGAMITSNTTWQSMSCHSIAKEVKHSCRTVIIAHVYTSDKTRFAIHEAVDDDLEADKT
ncbi:hypothetical protein B0H10DRAFT_2196935 [Mycena sp. CBHHK59/15]|nr:hypothetical protein B0H10DRAFT_2196935 [Mycena sp. CBHHK59/15]